MTEAYDEYGQERSQDTSEKVSKLHSGGRCNMMIIVAPDLVSTLPMLIDNHEIWHTYTKPFALLLKELVLTLSFVLGK